MCDDRGDECQVLTGGDPRNEFVELEHQIKARANAYTRITRWATHYKTPDWLKHRHVPLYEGHGIEGFECRGAAQAFE